MVQMIPLSKIHPSGRNVRKTKNGQTLEQLADNILEYGVLQNIVVEAIKKPRGHFAVVAGDRRHGAANILVGRGDWDADHDVPALVANGTDQRLTEISFAENFQREAMTAADECLAFQTIVAEGGDAIGIAKRFGITKRFVDGRLRLANLAPPIFAALAEGKMVLDVAQAYASTDNHEKQLRAFETYGAGNQGYGSGPDAIRRQIAMGSMRGDDPIALLVTEEAYAAAGGRVDRDLFTDKADDRWLDPETADRLAAALLEAEAARIAAESGLAWIRPIASTDTWSARGELYIVSLPPAAPTEDEAARLDAIALELETIETEAEDEALSDERHAELEAAYERLIEERERLDDRPPTLPDDWKAEVGCFLKLDRQGQMVLDSQYYSEKQLRLEQGEDGTVTGAFEERPSRSIADKPAPRPEATAPGGKPLSQRLFDELAVQRRDILAANLLADPGLALDYALFAMADKSAGSRQYGTTIRAERPQDPGVGELPVSRAREAIAQAKEELDSGWTGHKGEVDRFDAFRALDDDAKAAWLAYVVASSIEAKPTYDARQNPMQNRVAQLLDVDVAAWWRPTAANYFLGVNKTSLLTLLGEIGGATLSSRYAASKKIEIAENCEKLFSGHAIIESDVRERALAWVPDTMLFLASGVPSQPVLSDDDDEAATGGTDEIVASGEDGGEAIADDPSNAPAPEFVDEEATIAA